MKTKISFLFLINWLMLKSTDCVTWSYSGNNGPDHWPNLFAKYCSGRKQSPINLGMKTSIYDDSLFYYTFEVPNLQNAADCELYNDGKKIGIHCENATSKISVYNSPEMCLRPQGFHVHWGSADNVGSEHWLNGRQFAMEGHLVAWDCRYYSDYNSALNGIDGISVFAFLYEVVAGATPHPILQSMIEKFSKPNIFQCNACLQNLTAYQSETIKAFDFSKLFPQNRYDYWEYYGSLTTPNCNENVRWNVFNTPIQIPPEQIQAFRQLKFPQENGISNPMVNNFRNLMQLNPKYPAGAQRLLTRSFQVLDDHLAIPAIKAAQKIGVTSIFLRCGMFFLSSIFI